MIPPSWTTSSLPAPLLYLPISPDSLGPADYVSVNQPEEGITSLNRHSLSLSHPAPEYSGSY